MFPYWIKNYILYYSPIFFRKFRLERKLKNVQKRSDYNYILQRVNKYNLLENDYSLPQDAEVLRDFTKKNYKDRSKKFFKQESRASSYFFDSKEVVRWFNQNLKWLHNFGDVNYNMDLPCIVKTRPIGNDNKNSVILNLDKNRHFTFLNDKKDFASKKDILICRCSINRQEQRLKLFTDYFDEPWCDLGHVCAQDGEYNPKWVKPKINLYKHLDYKFIACFEGNDVASNLKWVMSSNSIAVMCKPTCESWFLENDLIADYHYIEVKEDLSNLKEKIDYYISNPDKAQQIVENAHRYVEQFFNKKREHLISLLVLKKYFEKSGQREIV